MPEKELDPRVDQYFKVVSRRIHDPMLGIVNRAALTVLVKKDLPKLFEMIRLQGDFDAHAIITDEDLHVWGEPLGKPVHQTNDGADANQGELPPF